MSLLKSEIATSAREETPALLHPTLSEKVSKHYPFLTDPDLCFNILFPT